MKYSSKYLIVSATSRAITVSSLAFGGCGFGVNFVHKSFTLLSKIYSVTKFL